MINESLVLFANHRYKQLKKIYNIDDTTLEFVLRTIQSLNPYPGYDIDSLNTEYIIPDLYVQKINDKWVVKK